MALSHAFTSSKAAATDTTVVDGPNWDADHVITGGNLGALLYQGTAGAPTGINSVAVGQALISAGAGTVPAWSNVVTLTHTSLATTPTVALALQNTTAAAAGAQQISPSSDWVGQGWKTDATAASQEVRFRADVLPVEGAAAPTGLWRLGVQIAAGAITYPLTVSSAGQVSALAAIVAGSGSEFRFPSSTRIIDTNDALLRISDSSGAFGIQFNTGTAAPTFNNGTVTTGSRNTCGQVTLTGGNTAGTVTFGAPNFTNTPLGIILQEVQGTNTAIVTAQSASAFSFTGATANGVVNFIVIGRI